MGIHIVKSKSTAKTEISIIAAIELANFFVWIVNMISGERTAGG